MTIFASLFLVKKCSKVSDELVSILKRYFTLKTVYWKKNHFNFISGKVTPVLECCRKRRQTPSP